MRGATYAEKKVRFVRKRGVEPQPQYSKRIRQQIDLRGGGSRARARSLARPHYLFRPREFRSLETPNEITIWASDKDDKADNRVERGKWLRIEGRNANSLVTT